MRWRLPFIDPNHPFILVIVLCARFVFKFEPLPPAIGPSFFTDGGIFQERRKKLFRNTQLTVAPLFLAGLLFYAHQKLQYIRHLIQPNSCFVKGGSHING